MITVITAASRLLCTDQLGLMFRARKRMFVDLFKWDLDVIDGCYEQDQFDTDDAVYLYAADAKGRHAGSLRLLPTTGRHLMREIFPDLCEGGPPVDPGVWEITRLCYATETRMAERVRIRQQLATALVEFGLLWGISRYTCLCDVGLISQVLSLGWDCEPLGLPRPVGAAQCGALAINISPETLKLFRDRFGLKPPIVQLPLAAAA
jgi:acyl-homoserine lactone synthase